jgi:hypothetical protein
LEGFDLAVLAQQMTDSMQTVVRATTPTYRNSQSGLITGDEIAALLAISLGGWALLVLYYAAVIVFTIGTLAARGSL